MGGQLGNRARAEPEKRRALVFGGGREMPQTGLAVTNHTPRPATVQAVNHQRPKAARQGGVNLVRRVPKQVPGVLLFEASAMNLAR